MRSDADKNLIDLLYRGTTTIQEFQWDNLTTVPILCLMTPEDIRYIKKLIMSPRYSGNNKLKLEKIDEIMHFRGFKKFAGGTNRVVYTHPSAYNTVFKVAIDSVGINDNPAEYRNQKFLKPYCCKVFECSPCGTIASFEKVERITTFEEFYSIADDYFYMLSRIVLGKYVMEDIGIDYFMNIGIRKGFGVVILDFPYLFELDGGKLECLSVLDDNSICHGEIEYEHGFNKLICTKCGRHYRARDLAKTPKDGGSILYKKGGRKMIVRIMEGDRVISEVNTEMERSYLDKSYVEKPAKKKQPTKLVATVMYEMPDGSYMSIEDYENSKKAVEDKDTTAVEEADNCVDVSIDYNCPIPAVDSRNVEARDRALGIISKSTNGKSGLNVKISTSDEFKEVSSGTTDEDDVEDFIQNEPVSETPEIEVVDMVEENGEGVDIKTEDKDMYDDYRSSVNQNETQQEYIQTGYPASQEEIMQMIYTDSGQYGTPSLEESIIEMDDDTNTFEKEGDISMSKKSVDIDIKQEDLEDSDCLSPEDRELIKKHRENLAKRKILEIEHEHEYEHECHGR